MPAGNFVFRFTKETATGFPGCRGGLPFRLLFLLFSTADPGFLETLRTYELEGLWLRQYLGKSGDFDLCFTCGTGACGILLSTKPANPFEGVLERAGLLLINKDS